MGTEGTPTADAPGGATTPPAPSALALLVATAVGGLVGARLGSKPLVVAAGATALAWLNRKTQEGVAVPSQAFTSPSLSPPAPPPAPFPSPSHFPPAPPAAAVMAPRMPDVQVQGVYPMATPMPSVVIAPPLADPRIEDWLARQMAREEHAAVLDLENGVVEMPAAEVAVAGGPDLARLIPEDDYTPESLLLEDFDEEPEWRSEVFTGLSEPVVQPPPVVASPEPVVAPPVLTTPFVTPPVMMVTPPMERVADEARPVFSTVKSAPAFVAGGFEPGANPWGSFPAPPPVHVPLSAPAPVVAPVYVAPIPEIEPLPSWNEAMGNASEAPLPAGAGGVELESLFTTPVFQGAALPDQIQMNPMPMPTPALMQEDPLATLFKPYEPAVAATPEVPAPVDLGARLPKVQEIEVHISAPGDAWFDSPLAGIPNPWGPPPVEEPELGATAPPSMAAPANVTKPVVDAEIVLRPRAPVQASVVPKVAPIPPTVDVVEPEVMASETDEGGLPSAPVKSPREQRARTTWRSWWRGD